MKKIIIIFSMLAVSFGCKKDPANRTQSELPGITTVAATNVYTTTALSGGVITTDGGDSITSRGVCWNTLHNPTIADSHTSDNAGIGTFSSIVSGLQPSSTYYLRAYATNSVGTAYGNEITITTLDHDIYLGGAIVNAAQYDVATIWKNGVATSLTDGTKEAYVNCIYVSNTDVYAGGIEHNGTNWVAKVWKNGVPTTLSDGTANANVYSICVSGSDVYLGGEDNQVAKIWKNGVATSLVGGTHISSLAVVGTNVYACGDYNTYPGSYAQFWKNGVLTELTDRTNLSNAVTLFVAGSDVYVGGREGLSAKIWKNAVGTALANGTSFTMVSAVCASGSNVYAAGFEQLIAGGRTGAKYWNNGTMTALTDESNNSEIRSMYLFGTDVFICGIDGASTKIWKNGTATVIDHPLNTVNTIYLK